MTKVNNFLKRLQKLNMTERNLHLMTLVCALLPTLYIGNACPCFNTITLC